MCHVFCFLFFFSSPKFFINQHYTMLLSCKQCFSEMHAVITNIHTGSRWELPFCDVHNLTRIFANVWNPAYHSIYRFSYLFFLSSAVTKFEMLFLQMPRIMLTVTVRILKIASLLLLLVGVALYFNIGTHLYQKKRSQDRSIGK